MNVLKRWSTTVVSSFDRVISQVENHEALIGSAIREMQQAGAKARVQLNKVKRDGRIMQSRVTGLEKSEAAWKERAIRVYETDEERALECVRRRKQIKKDISVLTEQINEHAKFEKQMEEDLKVIDERIAGLKRKKNALSARQYRAQALQLGNGDDFGLVAEIDETFGRWESKLEECEVYSSNYDDFEEGFQSEEDLRELKEELADLLAENV